jgi:hypothetical protein
MREFEHSGGKFLGQGSFGKVLGHPSWPYVLKMFPRDDCYLKYVRFAYNNPHVAFPKFYGLPRRIRPLFIRGLNWANPYIVRIEKLRNIPNSYFIAGNVEDSIEEFIRFKTGEMDPARLQEMQEEYDTLKQQKPEIYNLFEGAWLIKKNLPNCKLDLHGGNVMARENGEYVWVDPVWAGHFRNSKMTYQRLGDARGSEVSVKPGKKHSPKFNRYKRKRLERKGTPVPRQQHKWEIDDRVIYQYEGDRFPGKIVELDLDNADGETFVKVKFDNGTYKWIYANDSKLFYSLQI